MAWIEGLRGVILDVDGTLLDGDAAVPGAAEAVSRLRARRIPFRFVTNTTRRPRVAVAEALSRAGIPAEDAALEYAAGVEAEVIGKPSRAFYEMSLVDLGCEAKDVLVVGDDVENDCVGGAMAGCRTALVRTGKFESPALARSGAAPDLLLDSVADLL